MDEVWLLTSQPGYEVSSHGRVRSPNGIMKPEVLHNGYLRVRLGMAGRVRVHRLVLETFVGPCPEGHEAAHKDNDRSNNRLDNLAWKTRQGQHEDRRTHRTDFRGARSPRSRLTTEQVAEIRQRIANGERAVDLSSLFGVSASHITGIANRRFWRDA